MKYILFFVLLITVNLYSQTDTTTIQLSFSEPMDVAELFDANNYTITDKFDSTYIVYKIGANVTKDTVVIFCELLPINNVYRIQVDNVYDIARNLINQEEKTKGVSNKFPPDFIIILEQ